MVSHELKTPLTTLTVIVQILVAKLKDSDDKFVSGALDKANIQVKRMASMINGFLNTSLLESGKISLNKQSFDLDQHITEIVDELKMIIASHDIVYSSLGTLTVAADKDKIGSVISNFVSNAVKYSPRGTTIHISSKLIGKTVEFSVEDHGVGIKPLDIDKIFTRFYRVKTDDTRNISGYGMGLYLSSEIIHRHGGKIWASSQHGVGSTFYFTLPVA